MHDQLCDSIVKAYPAIRWFALGRAQKLADKIHLVVTNYRFEKTDETKAGLVKVGREAEQFLSQQRQSICPGVDKELQRSLQKIEM